MMEKILSVSLNPAIDVSCTAERIAPTVKIRTHDQVHDPGGCGVNVARVIATLGGKPGLLYVAGGVTGALLQDIIGQLPVIGYPIAASGATRISYTVRDLEEGLEYRFIPEGPDIKAGEFEQVLKLVCELDYHYIVLTGSLPKNAPLDVYTQLTKIAVERGARVILDSSGRALSGALSHGGVFLAKPSLEELEQLVGKSLNREQAGAETIKIIKRGNAENIVVSMGADGALLARNSGYIHAPAPKVRTGSAVGAGDSFVGAMVFALANGIGIEEAFHFGIAAGSAAVITTGTQLCRLGDVLRLYRREARERDQFEVGKMLAALNAEAAQALSA
ncbi:MAG: 1-phosphofructokinase family hexose kinase [Parasphingorhabdus sp.]|uniref:1-phosphofructokinase family hexose kinase n=1 Tax=Parasphingorhabdus sp. TaxID=2709688 RepID=UPI003001350C